MQAIIQKPILSEKAMKHTADGRYVFQCVPSTNKIEIKKAVEEMYSVIVTDVNTMIVAPKQRRRYTRSGNIKGSTSSYKKAIVTVQKGEKIDFFSNI